MAEDEPIAEEELEHPDDIEGRTAELRVRTAAEDRWDYARVIDDALTHAAATDREDGQADARPWRPLGPRNLGGRIRALAQHPTDPREMLAGSGQGGLWRTRDAGRTEVQKS